MDWTKTGVLAQRLRGVFRWLWNAAESLWGRPLLRGLAEFLIFFAVVAFARWETVRFPYWCDSLGYVTDGAQAIINANMNPLVHWEWDTGHPPLYYYMIAVIWRAFEGNVPAQLFAAHLLTFALSALGLWGTYRIGCALRGVLTGILAAALLFVSAAWFAQSGQMLMDLPIAALAAVALFCILRNRPWLYALSASAAALMKITIIPVLATLLVVSLIEGFRRGRKRGAQWAAAALLPLVLFGSWWLWHYLATGWMFHSPKKEAQFPHVESLEQMDLNLLWINFIRIGWRWVFEEGVLIYALPLMALAFLPSLGFWRGVGAALQFNVAAPRWRRLLGHVFRSVWEQRFLVYLLAISASVFGSLALTRHMGASVRYWLPAYPALFLFTAMGLRRLGRVQAVALALVLCWLLSTEWYRPPHIPFASDAAFNKRLSQVWDDSLQYQRGLVLYQQMARYIGKEHSDANVFCRWPILVLLHRPSVGYVTQPIKTTNDPNATGITLAAFSNFLGGGSPDALSRRYSLTPLATFQDEPFEIVVYRAEPREESELFQMLREWFLP